MKEKEKFSWKKRLRSFRYAFAGLWLFFKTEHNARIHVAAAVVALLLGYLLRISTMEWVVIWLCIGGVLAMEMVNSAIEALCDFVSPEKQVLIKKVKDLAAGAVLLSAVIALVVGLLVFVPKLC